MLKATNSQARGEKCSHFLAWTILNSNWLFSLFLFFLLWYFGTIIWHKRTENMHHYMCVIVPSQLAN